MKYLSVLKSGFLKLPVILFFLAGQWILSAQNPDTIPKREILSGTVTLSTKGLSTFPNLTLGKPAAIFDLSMGGDKFRFEPLLRFSMEGKPWIFVFWLRYELLKTEKLQFKIGAHPAYAFRTVNVVKNGTALDMQRAHPYFATEISPLFTPGKNFSWGPYYIHARGLESDLVQTSNFISLRANVNRIALNENYFLRWLSQAYFLQMDDKRGYYINSTLSANKRNSPFSISTTVNKAIDSNIAGDKFLWNLNLNYNFSKK